MWKQARGCKHGQTEHLWQALGLGCGWDRGEGCTEPQIKERMRHVRELQEVQSC